MKSLSQNLFALLMLSVVPVQSFGLPSTCWDNFPEIGQLCVYTMASVTLQGEFLASDIPGLKSELLLTFLSYHIKKIPLT